MGVFVRRPMDRIWNGGSDLQGGEEIYDWGYPIFWLILGSQNDPLWDPDFSPRCGQLAAPYLFAHKDPGPNSKLCT